MSPAVEKQKKVHVPKDASNIPSGKKLLTTARVCDFLDISDQSLLKLMRDPDESFPPPVDVVKGVRHWALEDIERYVERKQKQARKEDRR